MRYAGLALLSTPEAIEQSILNRTHFLQFLTACKNNMAALDGREQIDENSPRYRTFLKASEALLTLRNEADAKTLVSIAYIVDQAFRDTVIVEGRLRKLEEAAKEGIFQFHPLEPFKPHYSI